MRDLGELIAGLGAHPYTALPAGLDDAFQPIIAAFAGYQHVVKAAASGAKSFFDRMQAVQNIHIRILEGRALCRKRGVAKRCPLRTRAERNVRRPGSVNC